MEPDVFFPLRGASCIEAQRVCAECPVTEDCLNYAVMRPERHGIFGGLGEGKRKWLRQLQRASPHPESGTRFECECDYCAEVAVHLERLTVLAVTGRGPSPARPTFGPGATHGRRSTYARGCKCEPCRATLRPDYQREAS
jgi:WhiB family redox-sensing transcriptional regulator